MQYLGEYILQIENGKVVFPWKGTGVERMVWLVSASTYDTIETVHYTIVPASELEAYICETKKQDETFKILDRGDFILGEGGIWEVPERIRAYLQSDEIVLNGVGTFVEIMSVEDKDAYMLLLDELEEALTNAAIEEGLNYDHTNET